MNPNPATHIATALKRATRPAVIAGLRVIIAATGPAVRRLSRVEQADASPKDAPSFALIRVDLLGDIVFSLPAARQLKSRWPRSRITMVTLPQTAALATLDPDVDTVITIDTNAIRSVRGLLSIRTFSCILHAVKELRHQKFDATVSVYGLTASVLAMLTRSSRRLGYADEAYAGALDETVPGGRVGGMLRQHDWEFTKGLVDRVADTVSRRSAAAPQDSSPPLSHREAFPRIEVQEETRISAQRLLDASGVDRRKTLVVLHAGSRYGDFKRWPAGSYAQVARDLAAAGCEVVLVGAESDAPLASEIAAGAGVQSLAGRTTLEQLCAILARADLVISGDSGPLHLATAMGTKVIGLYGPTDPEVNGPRSWRGQEVLVLRRDIVCSPCYSVRVRAECPLGDPICMRLVPPETVLKAAAQMLDLWHGVKIKE